MGGTSKSQQTSSQQQQSTTGPWQPSQGLLQNILGGINGQFNNYQPNAAETGALNTIQQNAANAQNFAPQASGIANNLLTGATGNNADLINNAYSGLQNTLNPYTNPAYLDPTKTPGIQNLLDTITQDVSNNVNGQFAAAGRDLSGLNTQTLARGLSQGLAAPLLNQYNQNVQNQMSAANTLYGAGLDTAQGLQGLTQQGIQNQLQGLDVGMNIPNVANAGANSILDAAQQARQLPLQNLGLLSNLTIPIAGLGTQSQGSSSGIMNGTNRMSGAQQFALIAGGLGSMFRPQASPTNIPAPG